MSPSYRIVFYVSGHGFGHTSRTVEVIHAVLRARPDARRRQDVRAAASVRAHASRAMRGRRAAVRQRHGSARQPEHRRRREHPAGGGFSDAPAGLAEAEAAYLRGHGARLVVGDIPPLAFAAAAAAGIPSIAIGNFTWDWIYEGYRDDRRSNDRARYPARVSRCHAASCDCRWRADSRVWSRSPATFRSSPASRGATPDEVRHALGLPPRAQASRWC